MDTYNGFMYMCMKTSGFEFGSVSRKNKTLPTSLPLIFYRKLYTE